MIPDLSSKRSYWSNPPVLLTKAVAGEHEFEWLLCVASTFQACQRQRPIEVEETQRPSHPRTVGPTAMVAYPGLDGVWR